MALIKTSKLFTLDRFINEEQGKHPSATGEFSALLHDLTFAIRLIASNVRRAGLNDILGMTKNINIHGEIIRKLDIYANQAIYEAMDHGGHIYCMISEESENIIQIPSHHKRGNYILAFDPLDGSTNIDVCATIGSTFSLYKKLDPDSLDEPTEKDVLMPGYKQEAAGYALYGSSTILAYTTGNGVNIFTYDPLIGEFLLTFEDIRIPNKGLFYSCNEANSLQWSSGIRNYLNKIKTFRSSDGSKYSMRYIATAVADIHRLLHTGGIYLYPTEADFPEGKIRLLYEANPLSMLVEQAGGVSTTGKERILDIMPTSIHQRVPFFIGSKGNIEEILVYLKEEE